MKKYVMNAIYEWIKWVIYQDAMIFMISGQSTKQRQ